MCPEILVHEAVQGYIPHIYLIILDHIVDLVFASEWEFSNITGLILISSSGFGSLIRLFIKLYCTILVCQGNN